MAETLEKLRQNLRELQEQLEDEYRRRREALADTWRNGRMVFTAETRRLHRAQREGLLKYISHARFWPVVTAPVIYSMIIPFALMHFWVWVFQTICFPVYGIRKVPMGDFIAIDRHHLHYLNAIEKFNCVYCGYCNGVIGWAREVASRTEAYWCPIKHASRVEGLHRHYSEFKDYGDAEGYLEHRETVRRGKPAYRRNEASE